MKQVLVLVTAALLLTGLASTGLSSRKGTQVLSWSKKHTRKKVKINYTLHTAKKVKCRSCHPRHKNRKIYWKNCGKTGCHDKRGNAMQTGHKMCTGCHKKKGLKLKCGKCHRG